MSASAGGGSSAGGAGWEGDGHSLGSTYSSPAVSPSSRRGSTLVSAELPTDVATLHSLIRGLQAEVQDREDDCQEAEERVVKAVNQGKWLNTELKSARNRLAETSQHANELESFLEGAQRELAHLRSQNTSLQAQVKHQRTVLERTDEEQRAASEELAELTRERDSLRVQSREASLDLELATKRLKDLEGEVSQQEAVVQSLMRSLEQANRATMSPEHSFPRSPEALRSITEERDRYRKRATQFSQASERLQAELISVKEDLAAAEADNQAISDELNALSESRERDIAILSSEVETLARQRDEWKERAMKAKPLVPNPLSLLSFKSPDPDAVASTPSAGSAKLTVRTVVERPVCSVCDRALPKAKTADSPDGGSFSDIPQDKLLKFHFYSLLRSVKEAIRTEMGKYASLLIVNVRESNRLYEEAVSTGVPFSDWLAWLYYRGTEIVREAQESICRTDREGSERQTLWSSDESDYSEDEFIDDVSVYSSGPNSVLSSMSARKPRRSTLSRSGVSSPRRASEVPLSRSASASPGNTLADGVSARLDRMRRTSGSSARSLASSSSGLHSPAGSHSSGASLKRPPSAPEVLAGLSDEFERGAAVGPRRSSTPGALRRAASASAMHGHSSLNRVTASRAPTPGFSASSPGGEGVEPPAVPERLPSGAILPKRHRIRSNRSERSFPDKGGPQASTLAVVGVSTPQPPHRRQHPDPLEGHFSAPKPLRRARSSPSLGSPPEENSDPRLSPGQGGKSMDTTTPPGKEPPLASADGSQHDAQTLSYDSPSGRFVKSLARQHSVQRATSSRVLRNGISHAERPSSSHRASSPAGPVSRTRLRSVMSNPSMAAASTGRREGSRRTSGKLRSALRRARPCEPSPGSKETTPRGANGGTSRDSEDQSRASFLSPVRSSPGQGSHPTTPETSVQRHSVRSAPAPSSPIGGAMLMVLNLSATDPDHERLCMGGNPASPGQPQPTSPGTTEGSKSRARVSPSERLALAGGPSSGGLPDRSPSYSPKTSPSLPVSASTSNPALVSTPRSSLLSYSPASPSPSNRHVSSGNSSVDGSTSEAVAAPPFAFARAHNGSEQPCCTTPSPVEAVSGGGPGRASARKSPTQGRGISHDGMSPDVGTSNAKSLRPESSRASHVVSPHGSSPQLADHPPQATPFSPSFVTPSRSPAPLKSPISVANMPSAQRRLRELRGSDPAALSATSGVASSASPSTVIEASGTTHWSRIPKRRGSTRQRPSSDSKHPSITL